MKRYEEDILQAECQIESLSRWIEDGGVISGVADDIVTIDLPGNYITEVNLRPIQHLLSELRKLTPPHPH